MTLDHSLPWYETWIHEHLGLTVGFLFLRRYQQHMLLDVYAIYSLILATLALLVRQCWSAVAQLGRLA